MAAGKVTPGFSKPYVAVYAATGTTVTYSNGQLLARGVEVSLEPESSDDNKFYADNIEAENAKGEFTGGSVKFTVDGLKDEAERLIYGLPAASNDGWTEYGDDMNVPFCGVGFIARQQSGGVVTYTPTILRKVMFKLKTDSAKTQEDAIDWQTQELEASIYRSDDVNRSWKSLGKEYSTEAEAETALRSKLGITQALTALEEE